MTREEMKAAFECGAFNLVNVAVQDARPAVVREWLDYGDAYRKALSEAWGVMLDDEGFEEDSPLDGLAYGAFAEGWHVALRRVGQLLGIDPARFIEAVELLGEIGRDDLPQAALERLRRDTTDEAFDLGVVDAFDEYPPDARTHNARTHEN